MHRHSSHALHPTRRAPIAALAAATLLAAVLAAAAPADPAAASTPQQFDIKRCDWSPGLDIGDRFANIGTDPVIAIGGDPAPWPDIAANGTPFGAGAGLYFKDDGGETPAVWMNVGGVVRVGLPAGCELSMNGGGTGKWSKSGQTLTMLGFGELPQYEVTVPAGIAFTITSESGREDALVNFPSGGSAFMLEVKRVGFFVGNMVAFVGDGPGGGTLFRVRGPSVSPPMTTPSTPEPSPVDRGVAIAVEQAANVTGAGAVLVRDGAVVPMTTTFASGVGPRGGAVIEAEGMRITLDGGLGATESAGILVAPDGEIVCEICAALSDDSIVEAWIYSTPRLAAAVRVEVDTTSGECPVLRIPVGSPLDGGDGIEAGEHTLQLRLYTDEGFEVVATGITVGGPVPASVPAGEGPVRSSAALLLLGLLGAVAVVRGLQRRPAVHGG